MQSSNEALKSKQILEEGHPDQKFKDDQLLRLEKNKVREQIQPSINYQFAEAADSSQLNKAFDILFEETLKKNGDLTSYDNLV